MGHFPVWVTAFLDDRTEEKMSVLILPVDALDLGVKIQTGGDRHEHILLYVNLMSLLPYHREGSCCKFRWCKFRIAGVVLGI